MPFIPAIIAGVFAAVGGAIATVGTAIGLSGIATAIGGGIASFGFSLVGTFGLGAAFSAWTTAIAIGASIYSMFQGRPQPQSLGQQLSVKLNPNAPVPVTFGRTAVAGNLVFRATAGNKNNHLSQIMVLSAGGPVESIDTMIASNYTVTLNGNPDTQVQNGTVGFTSLSPSGGGSKLFSKIHVAWQMGHQPENLYNASTLGGLPQTDSHFLLSGLASVLTVMDYDTAVFPSGPPNLLFVGHFMRLYDPRLDSTVAGGSGSQRFSDYTTYTFSENPALMALNWCLGRYEQGSRVWGIGASFGEIDMPAFIAWANLCDTNGWKAGGQVSAADDKFQVLSTICQAGSARPVNRSGQLSVMWDALKTSLWDINPSDVIGDVTIQNTTALRDRKNQILPSYREESQFWTVIPGNLVTASAFLAEDGGIIQTIQNVYAMVQNATQAHQLAAYDLCNTREFLTMGIACTPRLLNARVGDCVTVNLPDIGVAGQKFLVMGRAFDPSNMQVSLTLTSETDSKHAFALGQSATAPAAPTLTSYDPSNPDVPGGSAWNLIGGVETANGIAQPALVVTGACDDPNAGAVITEYRPYGTSQWITWKQAPALSNSAPMQFNIMGVVSGQQYEVAVSYFTVRGVVGGRLILGPVTAGDQIISWTAPSTGNVAIVNLPPGLGTDSNGLLYASNVGFQSTTVYAALQASAAATNAISAATSAAYATANAAASNASLAAANAASAASATFAAVSNIAILQNTVTILTANSAGANAAILNETALRVANDAILSGQISTVSATANSASGAVTTETAARISNDAVLSASITILNANAVGANASITATKVSQASNNAAFSASIGVLTSNVAGANSTITTLLSAQASNNAAFTSSLSGLTASVAGANSTIATNQTLQAANNAVFTSAINTLNANTTGANAAISSLLVAQAANNTSFASSLTTLTAKSNDNPNLLPYGNFENGINGWTGWAAGGGVNADANWGVLAWSGTNPGVFAITSTSKVPLAPGQTYTLSGNIAPANNAITVYLDIQYYAANNVLIFDGGQTNSSNALVNGGPNYVHTEVAPTSTSYGIVRMVVNSNGVLNVSGFAQRIKLEQGSVATGYDATASVSTQASALTTLSGQAYSTYTLTASAGNVITGMQLLASNGATSVSSVIFDANTIIIQNGSAGAKLTLSNSVLQVFDTSGTLRVRLGLW
jgi:hypothetical protein